MSKATQNQEKWCPIAEQSGWRVEEMAKLLKISVRSLQRQFPQPKRPKEWLNKQRHEQALTLLRAGYLVKQVAARLGYEHSSSFSRQFKKFWGFSPAQAGDNLMLSSQSLSRIGLGES